MGYSRKTCYETLSRNPNITSEIVRDYPEYEWDKSLLLTNPDFGIKYYQESELEDKIDYKNCTIDIIDRYKLEINYYTYSRNVNLTIDYIKDNLNKNWDWYYLPTHGNINVKMITDNNFPWKFDWLGCNRNIKIGMFDERPKFKYNIEKEYIYNWSAISRNPNITYDFIIENIADIEFGELSYNLFGKDDFMYKNKN